MIIEEDPYAYGLLGDGLTKEGWRTYLNLREFMLVVNPGQTYTREEIVDRPRGDGGVDLDVIDVYVSTTRRNEKLIETITGHGYRLGSEPGRGM
ncbi:winged helix-turn-helix domain-containing protein (plasmid) [Deinococcus radiomollis]|uniref:winged helix-turn-helix domain-containing protein n=1 Tax=Deinococcus radiomollis TaxID=468916 RepID=UPI003892223D